MANHRESALPGQRHHHGPHHYNSQRWIDPNNLPSLHQQCGLSPNANNIQPAPLFQNLQANSRASHGAARAARPNLNVMRVPRGAPRPPPQPRSASAPPNAPVAPGTPMVQRPYLTPNQQYSSELDFQNTHANYRAAYVQRCSSGAPPAFRCPSALWGPSPPPPRPTSAPPLAPTASITPILQRCLPMFRIMVRCVRSIFSFGVLGGRGHFSPSFSAPHTG